ncbi:MAG: hypothetical protein JNK04_07430 [Myxococcales bacterium]|nr:hypothetical protein [Myxococcales bacterium]
MRKPQVTRHKLENADYEIHVVGAPRESLRDFYLAMLRFSWPASLSIIALGYLLVNAAYALVYSAVGGVDNMHEGSFLEAFFFSVQTMGTIGYGGMAPHSRAANLVVVSESVVSLIVTALATGLVFAKFSRPSARVMFSQRATIGLVDGVRMFSCRISNQRSNTIVDAEVRLSMVRTDVSKDGKTFYRTLELPLVRSRISSLSRSWTIQHVIDDASPLSRETEESCATKEIELQLTISGTDDLFMQSVHAARRYTWKELAWGYRLVDIMTDNGDTLVLDLTRFHDIEPVREARAD